MSKRGPEAKRRRDIQVRAEQMRMSEGRINKSRIARELHVSLRYVFKVLRGASI